MYAAIVYTALSVLNLIGFVAGILTLPAQTPIHFDASMTADAVGSPWVFVALPAATALISAAIWTTSLSKREGNRKIFSVCLSAVGAILAVVGWVFFALISSGVQAGQRADFPVALCIVLPLSLLFVFLGVCLPKLIPNKSGIRSAATRKNGRVFEKANRFAGILFLITGTVSAALTVALSVCAEQLCFLSAIVFAGGVLIASAASLLYAKIAAGREEADPGKREP